MYYIRALYKHTYFQIHICDIDERIVVCTSYTLFLHHYRLFFCIIIQSLSFACTCFRMFHLLLLVNFCLIIKLLVCISIFFIFSLIPNSLSHVRQSPIHIWSVAKQQLLVLFWCVIFLNNTIFFVAFNLIQFAFEADIVVSCYFFCYAYMWYV